MSKEQLVQRMLCAEANIDSQRLRIGELRDEDWDSAYTDSRFFKRRADLYR